jgi:alkylhydroperoxidase family enzyme
MEVLMAVLLNEIEWGDPILPAVADPAWEAEVQGALGAVFDLMRRVSPSPWVRTVQLGLFKQRARAMPQRLADIGFLVTSQENACRYCYGAAKAQLRMLGYSERLIGKIEREAQVAELDEKERAFIHFCRNLARSKPRPMKAERQALLALGFAPLAVAEMAAWIVTVTFLNRVATFIACPPEHGFEKMAGSLKVWLLRPLLARKARAVPPPAPGNGAPNGAVVFGPIVKALAGLPAAGVLNDAFHGAFSSPVLPRATKALMFAVVARSLGCTFCEGEARRLLLAEGFTEAEIDAALATLASPRLAARDASILAWTRDTVHYQPAAIQHSTRALAAEIGDAALIEAVGVAALANATVRLAMLIA